MINWILSLFKRRETTIEKAHRLGYKYLKVSRVGTNTSDVKNGKIYVYNIDSGGLEWVTLEKFNEDQKRINRDNKLNLLLKNE